MKRKNRIVKWVLIVVTAGVFIAAMLLQLLSGQRDAKPWALPCGYSLEDQVTHPRYGADMIFEITIKDSQFLEKKNLCEYSIAIDKTLLELKDISKYDLPSDTAASLYEKIANIPKSLTVYDNLHYPAEVRGRKTLPPPCDAEGTRYLLFLHRLYFEDFIEKGMLHCRGAAYLRPITDKETVLKYLHPRP